MREYYELLSIGLDWSVHRFEVFILDPEVLAIY